MNKGMSGILKLRLVITALFLMMVISVAISIYIANDELQAEEEFFGSLTSDEIYDIQRIYSDYPEVDDSGYAFAGWMLYAVTGVLFFLMIKVWQTPSIY